MTLKEENVALEEINRNLVTENKMLMTGHQTVEMEIESLNE